MGLPHPKGNGSHRGLGSGKGTRWSQLHVHAEPRFSYPALILRGNIHKPHSVTVPPAQGPGGARDRGAGVLTHPFASRSLTQGPGTALFDGFVFAPGQHLSAASSGSLPSWLSQSQATDPEIAQGTRLGGLGTRPHHSRRPLMNHARSTPRATSASPPRLLPRPPGQVRSPAGEPGRPAAASYIVPRRTWGTRLHPKVGICG